MTDTLDAALGYTREFLFPEHAHRQLVDLPDSAARNKPAHPSEGDSAAPRVKRKYTRRNKDAVKKTSKPGAATHVTTTDPCNKNSKNKADIKSGTGKKNVIDSEKDVTSRKMESLPGSGNSSVVRPSVSKSENNSRRLSDEVDQDGGIELPVLEKHPAVLEAETAQTGAQGVTSSHTEEDLTNEEQEMPELTIAAF